MISPCYAFTNHHVVFGDDLKVIPKKNYDMVVRAGVGNDNVFAGRTLAVPVSWGSRDEYGSSDWAIIRLHSCIGLRPDIGWFKIRPISQVSFMGRTIIAVGYPGITERGVLATSAGKVVGVDLNNGMLKTTASWAPGQSGGPVLDAEGYFVSGIISASGANSANPSDFHTNTYSDDRANKFTNIDFVTLCAAYSDWLFSATQSAENADYFRRRIPLQYPRLIVRIERKFENGRHICVSSLKTVAS